MKIRITAVILAAVVVLAVLSSCAGGGKNSYDYYPGDGYSSRPDGYVDKDQMAALPQKSLLDESEIPEELITNPMLENEVPVWLAKINGKIFAYGEGKIQFDVICTSEFHGFGFMSNHLHCFYSFDIETGKLKRATGAPDDDFITEEEAEQLFETVKKSYETKAD
ncbi:MAG: hypothetical protein IKX86_07055 [Clostridia bacterium]|nr:hypothetical protein [Clostridia bacterium]MBR5768412.1 hypothetical protein [Clostridia bacterium]